MQEDRHGPHGSNWLDHPPTADRYGQQNDDDDQDEHDHDVPAPGYM